MVVSRGCPHTYNAEAKRMMIYIRWSEPTIIHIWLFLVTVPLVLVYAIWRVYRVWRDVIEGREPDWWEM
jgi:ABC-type multidrug transport system permease subunit